MNEHGYCPACKADMDGGSIWEHFYKETESEAEADKMAKSYGADRTKGKWGRKVGIYCMELDRTVAYECPDCGHQWSRTEKK